jgi:hypothetical protein
MQEKTTMLSISTEDPDSLHPEDGKFNAGEDNNAKHID